MFGFLVCFHAPFFTRTMSNDALGVYRDLCIRWKRDREEERMYERRAVTRLESAETYAEGGRETERGRGGTNLGNQRVEGGRSD